MSRGAFALLLSVIPGLAGAGNQKPPSLVAFEQARHGIRAEFSVVCSSASGEPRHYHSIAVGDDVAYFEDGSPSGISGYTEDGEPVYGQEENVLRLQDAVWRHQPDSLFAQVRRGSDVGRARATLLDFRTVGMVPSPDLATSPLEALSEPHTPGARVYSETRAPGGLFTVKGYTETTGEEITWQIDPAKGWNAVSVQRRVNGVLRDTAVTEYEGRGDTWVPTRVTYSGPDSRVRSTLELAYSKVGTADIPPRLTPRDIGVRPGMTVSVLENGAASSQIWTGQNLVSMQEGAEMIRRGEIVPDPEYAALRRRRIAESAPRMAEWRLTESLRVLSRETDPWERYVTRFIRDYALNGEQAQTAKRTLKDCQEQRDRYLTSKKDQIDALKDRAAAKERSAEAMEALQKEVAGLMERVDAIFNGQLKPRLMKIPTRKQIEQAQVRTSQPHSRPSTRPAQPQ
jgi:hypothetical protein